MKIKLSENAKKILDTMHEAGFEAYVVGGCVRDAILGREPGDWDITTNAVPADIQIEIMRFCIIIDVISVLLI